MLAVVLGAWLQGASGLWLNSAGGVLIGITGLIGWLSRRNSADVIFYQSHSFYHELFRNPGGVADGGRDPPALCCIILGSGIHPHPGMDPAQTNGPKSTRWSAGDIRSGTLLGRSVQRDAGREPDSCLSGRVDYGQKCPPASHWRTGFRSCGISATDGQSGQLVGSTIFLPASGGASPFWADWHWPTVFSSLLTAGHLWFWLSTDLVTLIVAGSYLSWQTDGKNSLPI